MKTTQRETQEHLMNQDGIKKMSNWPTGRQGKRNRGMGTKRIKKRKQIIKQQIQVLTYP